MKRLGNAVLAVWLVFPPTWIIIAAWLVFFLALQSAHGQAQSPGTTWAPWPATPPISASGPPISAGPVTMLNNHMAVAGQRYLAPGCGWDNWACLNSVAFTNGVESGLNPANQALIQQHLNNCAALGFRLIRIHGLDSFAGGNLFGAATAKSTLQVNPICMQALAWFMDQCKQRNIRLIITCHFNRLATPADLAILTNNGANPPPPEIAELFAHGYYNLPPGGLWPWVAFFPSVQALDAQFETQMWGYVSPYDGLPLGKNPALAAVIVRNEQLLGKNVPYGFPALPVLNSGYNTLYAAALTSLGIATPKYDAIEHSMVCAWMDVQLAKIEMAHLRTLCPQALMISNTFYGDSPYSGLPGCWAGDLKDCHYYSGPSPNNGFLNIIAPAVRTQFQAYLAGTQANTVSEWAGVAGTLDPPVDQAQLFGAVTAACIAQDVDATMLYSYASSPIQTEGSPYWKPSVWDMRVVAPLMTGVQYWNAQFVKPRAVSPPTVTVKPTYGLYGYQDPVTHAYSRSSPLTDPAILAVPASTRAILAP